MALKYQCTYKDIFTNTYIIGIYDTTFGGTQSDVIMGSVPVRLDCETNTDDIDAQIIGQKAIVQLVNESAGQYDEFFTSDTERYNIQVIKAGTIIFSGHVSPESYTDAYEQTPYVTQVVFNDPSYNMKGKAITLVGVHSLLDVLQHCLNKGRTATLYEAIDIYENTQDNTVTTDSMLTQTYVDAVAFEGMDCYEAVVEIMKRFCAQLWWYSDSWYCGRITGFAASSVRFREFNSAGTFQSAAFHDMSDNTTGGDEAISSINALTTRGVIDFKPGFKRLIIEQDYQRINDNDDLVNLPSPLEIDDSWPDPWQQQGSLDFQEVSSSVPFSYETALKIKTSGQTSSSNYMYFSQLISQAAGQTFQVNMSIMAEKGITSGSALRFHYVIYWDRLDGSTYYAQPGGTWTTTYTELTEQVSGLTGVTGFYEITVNESIDNIPDVNVGELQIRILGTDVRDASSAIEDAETHIKTIEMIVSANNLPTVKNLLIGITADNDNAKELDIEYVIGDIIDVANVGVFYNGGLYLADDKTERTTTWDIAGDTEQESLNLVVGEEYATMMKIHRKLISTILVSSIFLHYKSLLLNDGTYLRLIQSSFDTKRCTINVDYVELNTT